MSKFRAAITTAAILAATVGGMVAMSGEAHADGRLKSDGRLNVQKFDGRLTDGRL